MFNSVYRIPRRIRIFILFIIIIFGVFYRQNNNSALKKYSAEFLKAREEASLMAKNIVVISGKTAENINKISDF